MAQDTAKPNQKITWGQQPSPGVPSAHDIQNGEGSTYFLDRYRVVDEIGVGGMASVHLARLDGDGGFQRWVAIKKMHPHLIEDESFVQMFLDEARVAGRISHPNVAAVLELGKHDETYWIVMEYLHGEPLREVMRRSEEVGQIMPCDIACRVVADAAEGLHAAHELLGRNGEQMGLVHRDVTPHNLFVTYDGTTKVVDFGIAKFAARMASTRAGTLKGKLAYMSPEQIRDQPLDRRTDIFALGVVLWEITTGQRLFRSDNDIDTIAKVQECIVPRPTTVVPGYPIDLEKIVMKALARNKNERFKTAREMSRALQMLLMKRNVFVASDEIAQYMRETFRDRIQKRDAHLRWAAEVTRTVDVNVDPAPPRYPAQEDRTFNSDVQPANPPKVRPAAGVPANERGSRPPPPEMQEHYPTPHQPDYSARVGDYAPATQGPDGEPATIMQTPGLIAGLPSLDLSSGNDPLIEEDDQDETVVVPPKIDPSLLRSTRPPAPPRPRSAPMPARASEAPRPRESVPPRHSQTPSRTPTPSVDSRTDPKRPQWQERPSHEPPRHHESQQRHHDTQRSDYPSGRGASFESRPGYSMSGQSMPGQSMSGDRPDAIQPAYVHHSGNYPYAPPPVYAATARVAVRRRPPMFVIVALGVAGAVLVFALVVLLTSRPTDQATVEHPNPFDEPRRGFVAILSTQSPNTPQVPQQGTRPFNGQPNPNMGTLVVSCAPKRCDRVLVNGASLGPVGETPISTPVQVGKSVIKFYRGTATFDEIVTVTAGTEISVRR